MALIAAALGLVEDELFSNSLSAVIQVMNRFVLERMSSDYKQVMPQSILFEQVRSLCYMLLLSLTATDYRDGSCDQHSLCALSFRDGPGWWDICQ